MDAMWMREWTAFASDPHAPSPGKINNRRLLGKDRQLRVGLELERDYVAVTREVWGFLHGRYGGGPELVRDTSKWLAVEMLLALHQDVRLAEIAREPRDSSRPALRASAAAATRDGLVPVALPRRWTIPSPWAVSPWAKPGASKRGQSVKPPPAWARKQPLRAA